MNQIRKLLPNLALCLATTAVLAFIGEIGLRYVHKAWPFELEYHRPEYLTARDDSLRYRFSSKGDRNSLGLRNREITEKRNRHRILFLGDSLVFSGETSGGELYTQTIEKILNEDRLTAASPIEVINAGIPGYTTYQELEFLKIYGLEMQPDTVILGVVFNDLFQYLHQPTRNQLMALEPRRYLQRFDVDTFPGCLFSRSYLAHATMLAWQISTTRLTGSPSFAFEYRDDFYTAWKDHAWRNEADLIRQFQELLKKHDIHFGIVCYPIIEQVDDRNLSVDRDRVLYPQRQLATICRSQGIPYLDLTDTIHANGGTNLFRDYLHLNGKGNDLLATTLAPF